MPAILFRAEVRAPRGLVTIELHGDIDLGAEAGLAAAYGQAAVLDATTILLDFTDTDYINSTGIALIVRLLADARSDHREIQVCGLSPHYLEIFRITRLIDYVRIVDDAADPAAAAAADVASRTGEDR